jgi:2-hydroxychromene-2-carboxylate isomerase
MAQPIEFYFEFASPYGYLASLRIDDLAARHGRKAVWRPIMLGAAFKLTRAQPLVEIPLKRDYFVHDVQRFARLWGTPLTLPASMPMNSLAASRAYWWLFDSDPRLARDLAARVYAAHWGEGRDLARPEAVAEIAKGLGIEPAAVIEAVAAQAVKDRLRAETEAAIGRGVFGSPFVVVDGEAFWGADRLDQVDAWLARGGW